MIHLASLLFPFEKQIFSKDELIDKLPRLVLLPRQLSYQLISLRLLLQVPPYLARELGSTQLVGMRSNPFQISGKVLCNPLDASPSVIEFDILLVPLFNHEGLVCLEVPVAAGYLAWTITHDHPGVCFLLHDTALERAVVLSSKSFLVSGILRHLL